MAAETYRFADDGTIPNSALPLLLYRRALADADLAGTFERRFAANDWRGGWRNGIYGFHHFLGKTVHGAEIPAGVGHCLERGSRDLLVVGAYPEGREWDLRRGNPDERAEVLANIALVPLPTTDPLFGADGPLIEAWSSPVLAGVPVGG